MNSNPRFKPLIDGNLSERSKQYLGPRALGDFRFSLTAIALVCVFLEVGYGQTYFSSVGVEPRGYGLDTTRFPGSDPSIRAQNCLIALGAFDLLGGVCDM